MPIASISGLASGLDTASIINQLMQLEANPQTLLKQKLSDEKSSLTSLQTVNSKFAQLATRASELMDFSNWSPLKATSSSEHVSVTVGSGASTGGLSFNVLATAQAHHVSFNTTGTLDEVVATPDSTLQLHYLDGRPSVTIETGDGTMRSIRDALNASGAEVEASLSKAGTAADGESTYRLHLRSTTTGADTAFDLTAADGTTPALGGYAAEEAGRDAQILVDGLDTLTSATNTFTGVLPGVDIALAADTPVDTAVDLSVVNDSSAMGADVKALVDAINSALSDIDSLTSYDSTTKSSGQLAGDPNLRFLDGALLGAVTDTDGTSLASIGIELTRDGKLTFDREKFEQAYEVDAEATAALFTDEAGFAGRLHTISDGASDSINGTITSTIKGTTSGIERLEDSIAQWDIRLDLRRASLTRQYTALEVALGQMNSQSTWLAGQIGSLPDMNS